MKTRVYLGIDSGATTCKVNGVDAEGRPLSKQLRQYPTRSSEGTEAILNGWLGAMTTFLDEEGIDLAALGGVGLAMPGPFQEYGVLGKLPNYPADFQSWPYLNEFAARLKTLTGRTVPCVTGNDGHLAGLAEAVSIQREQPGAVFLLAPGSGLGSAFVAADGQMLEGDHLSAAFFCSMPLPYAEIGLPRLPSTCGRTWACAESYTALSGLGDLIEIVLPRHPGHPFVQDPASPRQKALALRGLAREDDPLALEVFDLQARAMGLAVAMASMAYDPTHIVIGGGLIDPEATTPTFRRRYLDTIRQTAADYLWIDPAKLHYHEARHGEHSQSIGAALAAMRSIDS
jgi:predicted NBD/HSP70 family sugar kinase